MSGHLRRRREPLRTWWLNWYVYIVPSILLIAYVMYVLVGVHKYSIPWLGDSEGFSEMCKAIVDFSSIVLGIYGFLIPAVIGRQDKFFKRYPTLDNKWNDYYIIEFWIVDCRYFFTEDVCICRWIPLVVLNLLLL